METGFLHRAGRLLPGRQGHLPQPQRSQPAAVFNSPRGIMLAYDEYGQQSGYPLFYFHDAGSSRLEAALFHRAARTQGFRLIAIDRPGVGCSDFYDSASTADFCLDVLHLANQLGLDQFGVMSFGAGGVYATTLSHMRPHRVTAHLNLAGVPGHVFNEAPSASLARHCLNELTPALIKLGVRLQHALRPDRPEESLARMDEYLSYTDRKMLALPKIRQVLALDHHEAMRNGARGVAQDLAMCFRKLEFRLHEVAVPTMVWQGSADRLSSRSDCEYLVARMPNARYFRVPNRGHFFFVNYMDEVFSRLRASAGNAQALAA